MTLMNNSDGRTYTPYTLLPSSKQREYTVSTPLLNPDGTLNAKGWARRNVFEYDRRLVSKRWSKEWEFYLVNNGTYMGLVSIVGVALGGYANVAIVDVKKGKFLESATVYYLGRCNMTEKGDAPGGFSLVKGDAVFSVKNTECSRDIYFKKGETECSFHMDVPLGSENITTVFPFKDKPKHFFMTTKQNCLPCEGSYTVGEKTYEFSRKNTFCCMDWGRIAAPREVVWYWGNGSTKIIDERGEEHLFGFELTWGIGDESYATETCLFYDGKAHKIDAADVEIFPKPDKYMQPWHIVSRDGRFDMTMIPDCDNHTDTKILSLLRMHGHQVFGSWSGKAVLDDGTVLHIENMHAFCEYVENKW